MSGLAAHLLESRSNFDSPIHRAPAWLKLWTSVPLIVALVAIRPRWTLFISVFAALLFVAILSRLSFTFLLKRLLLLEPFVLGVAVLSLFQPNGKVIFVLLVVRSTLC